MNDRRHPSATAAFAIVLILAQGSTASALFETRPTTQQVNNILLPLLIAQKKHPESGFELPRTDLWWAWRNQFNMAIDEPITNVMHLAAHNSYNSMGDGYDFFPGLAPNQILSVTGLLNFGARLIEIDIHDGDSSFLTVFHAADLAGERHFTDVLGDVRGWLQDNPTEVVFLDIEDGTTEVEGTTADTSVAVALRQFFGDPDDPGAASLLFTPEIRAELGRWPSRRELLAMSKRVIVFTHRNDSGNGRFGAPVQHTDPNGHSWYAAGLAYRANGGGDPVAMRGNFLQIPVQDFSGAIADDPGLLANENFFLSMQSDGIDQIPPTLTIPLIDLVAQIVDLFTQFDAKRATPGDARFGARMNANFLKMDFLFGHDEDAGLGSNAALFYGIPYNRDDAYEIENDGSRTKRLRFALWSWAEDDPAARRQIFQDLEPGDGSGAQQLLTLSELIGSPDLIDDLTAMGAAARGNGRDFGVQRTTGGGAPDRRWTSVHEDGGVDVDQPAEAHPFALRSSARDPATGRYRWKLSQFEGTRSDVDLIPTAELTDGDGFRYAFGAPVNGLQNEDLWHTRQAAGNGEDVWINVNDTDRNGLWTVCPCAPEIDVFVVMEPAIDEDGLGWVAVRFSDRDPFDRHTIEIDWGDGTPPETVLLPKGDRVLDWTEHRYLDDAPSGTSADDYVIEATLSDGFSEPVIATRPIRVRNVPPSVETLANGSPETAPAREGEAVETAGTFTDVGPLDIHEVLVDWDDGTLTPASVSEAGGSGAFAAAHAYSEGGVYEILALVRDDDTGESSRRTTAFIAGVGLRDGVLQVVGTESRDVVTVHQENGRAIKVHADFLADGPFRRFDLDAVERIEIYVCDDGDRVNLAGNLEGPEVEVQSCP